MFRLGKGSHRVGFVGRQAVIRDMKRREKVLPVGQLDLKRFEGYDSEVVCAVERFVAKRSSSAMRYLYALVNAEFGLTDLEASRLLKMKVTTVCARRGDLRNFFPYHQGFVREADEKRMGDSGQLITVWEIRPDFLKEYRKRVSPDWRIDGTVSGVNA